MSDAVTDDFVYGGRQLVVWTHEVGRAAHVKEMQIVAEQGVEHIAQTVLATRGERLALAVLGGVVPDQFSSELLAVIELAGARLASFTTFDTNDVDSATEELDRRYSEGEGAPFADTMRLAVASVNAYNARDWTALLALYAPDVVVIDRRPASLGEFSGREILVHDVQGTVAVSPNIFMWTAEIYPSPHGSVSLMRATATTDDGGEIEVVFWSVAVVRDGVITQLEYFPVEQADMAKARSGELLAEH